jgi:hypothetical protein
MDIGIEYLCEDRTGLHVFSVHGGASATSLCDEVARQVRNLCALVGPSLIRIVSPENVLAGCAGRITDSEWLLSPEGVSLIDIVSRWRGVPTGIEFVAAAEQPVVRGARALSTGVRRPPTPTLPALVVNIGQSEVKLSVVARSLETRNLRTTSRGLAEESRRPRVLLGDVRHGIAASLESARIKPDQLASVVYSVGALVGRGQIALVANGITGGLGEVEIDDLRNALAALPFRLGAVNAQVTFVNDGLLLAMAHTDLAAPGSTLALRCGTSLCGGVDDEGVLGEIGWVGLASDSQRGERGRSGGRVLARDLLSADAFLAVDAGVRAGYLARSLDRLLTVASRFCEISRVVLCGSLFTAVDHVAFREACSQLTARSPEFSGGTDISFSKLRDQRGLAARGVVNMVLAGMPR